MGRIMAIDYGMKRVGLAVTDPLKIIARGLTTVENQKLLEFIVNYAKEEEIEAFVIGEPVNWDGTLSHIEGNIVQFIQQLTKAFPNTPIHRQDEWSTSKMAAKTLYDSGLRKKARQNKALIDEVSATIILQSFMERI